MICVVVGLAMTSASTSIYINTYFVIDDDGR
jgi:hypothetical protein